MIRTTGCPFGWKRGVELMGQCEKAMLAETERRDVA